MSAAASSSPNTKGDGGVRSSLYAYEVPSVPPGDYEIITKQTVTKSGYNSEQLISVQPITVRACQPYALSPELVHSFYPPNQRTVSATTLPHIVLKGATAWERSREYAPGTAPTPWLALLLFTSDELCVPAEVLSSTIRPSATKCLTLPLKTFNSVRTKFCHRNDLSDTEVTSKPDGPQATADFIFAKSKAFRMYFERQDLTNKSQQAGPELDRYSLLAVMTDTGMLDKSGHTNAKLSTLIGHRTRPYTPVSAEQMVHAHVVSIEGLESQIDWKAAQIDSSTVALVSLFSWTFNWAVNNSAEKSLEMFRHLSEATSIRSLEIPMKEEEKQSTQTDPSLLWVRERIVEGYTIVRHRDIAGEASMALYRGPLIPRASHRARIKPSLHGTDLQIIDVSAKILDISYSTAWALGRSLASRDSKFSAAMAELRRQLYIKAVSNARTVGLEDQSHIMHQADDVMDSALGKLDTLFEGSIESKLMGRLPQTYKDDAKTSRWKVPQHNATSIATAPGVVTMAKLKRHLEGSASKWIIQETEKIYKTPLASDTPQLAVVFNWIINNLMSLKLVPATYLFPDPAVLVNESLNCFLIDDVWIDALVDGAVSIANTMGGGEDPVRGQILEAFNFYLRSAPMNMVQIGGSGFILRSGIVESFPDLEITITTKENESSNPVPLPCPYKTQNEDMILCLVARGREQKLVDYTVKFKLPQHQQRFAMENIFPEKMTFDFELGPFLRPDNVIPPPGGISVTWTRDGKVDPPNPPCPPLWSWDTGVLAPHIVVNMMDHFIDTYPKCKWDKPSADSKSFYLVTQLTDRDHCITVNLMATNGTEKTPREIMPEHAPVEDDTRDDAVVHDPQEKVTSNESESGKSESAPAKSWFKKQAFSQDFPGESIPAMSNSTQNIVFAVKPTGPSSSLPTDTEVLSMEFSIPLGEGSTDLLDPLAPLPTVRAIGTKQQWIAAVTHKKAAAEIVVHLKPRGKGGAKLTAGLDASFMLVRATVNGVMGRGVKIQVKEVYERKEKSTESGKDTPKKTQAVDSWLLVKE